MESFLNRYRSITILLLVILAQLVLVAVQVKNDQDVRIIRVWTVTAVTPVARTCGSSARRQFGSDSQLHSAARCRTRKTAGCRPKWTASSWITFI
jgi:hypothetical protein